MNISFLSALYNSAQTVLRNFQAAVPVYRANNVFASAFDQSLKIPEAFSLPYVSGENHLSETVDMTENILPELTKLLTALYWASPTYFTEESERLISKPRLNLSKAVPSENNFFSAAPQNRVFTSENSRNIPRKKNHILFEQKNKLFPKASSEKNLPPFKKQKAGLFAPKSVLPPSVNEYLSAESRLNSQSVFFNRRTNRTSVTNPPKNFQTALLIQSDFAAKNINSDYAALDSGVFQTDFNVILPFDDKKSYNSERLSLNHIPGFKPDADSLSKRENKDGIKKITGIKDNRLDLRSKKIPPYKNKPTSTLFESSFPVFNAADYISPFNPSFLKNEIVFSEKFYPFMIENSLFYGDKTSFISGQMLKIKENASAEANVGAANEGPFNQHKGTIFSEGGKIKESEKPLYHRYELNQSYLLNNVISALTEAFTETAAISAEGFHD